MIKIIYNLLLKRFGKQNWWPIISNNPKFEISIGAILTQNTSWNNVEKAVLALKEHNLLTKEALSKINIKKLSSLIKPAGYYNLKAKKLKEFVNFLNSKKPITKENLLNIWGVGPETADSILCYAYTKPYFVVDAYTKRIFERLNIKEKTYDEIQNLVHKNLSSKYFNEFHALLVRLAKENCRKNPICNSCPLIKLCNFSNK